MPSIQPVGRIWLTGLPAGHWKLGVRGSSDDKDSRHAVMAEEVAEHLAVAVEAAEHAAETAFSHGSICRRNSSSPHCVHSAGARAGTAATTQGT